jgi:DNA-binding MarR family transcriptional regulator
MIDPKARLKCAELERSILHLLHRAGQCATWSFDSQIDDKGLTVRQYAVLRALASHEHSSQTDLVEMTGIDRSTLSDMVNRMTKRGLLQRRRSRTDSRAYNLKLSEAGQIALSKCAAVAEKAEKQMLAPLSTAQSHALFEALLAIIDAHKMVDTA